MIHAWLWSNQQNVDSARKVEAMPEREEVAWTGMLIGYAYHE